MGAAVSLATFGFVALSKIYQMTSVDPSSFNSSVSITRDPNEVAVDQMQPRKNARRMAVDENGTPYPMDAVESFITNVNYQVIKVELTPTSVGPEGPGQTNVKIFSNSQKDYILCFKLETPDETQDFSDWIQQEGSFNEESTVDNTEGAVTWRKNHLWTTAEILELEIKREDNGIRKIEIFTQLKEGHVINKVSLWTGEQPQRKIFGERKVRFLTVADTNDFRAWMKEWSPNGKIFKRDTYEEADGYFVVWRHVSSTEASSEYSV